MAAGAPIDLRVSLSGQVGEEGTRRIAAMIKTFIQMGGWSAYYTLLSKESQKVHLKRVEHGLA